MGAQGFRMPPPVNIPKPTLADVPEAIKGSQNFNAQSYAPNTQQAMQNIYNLQQGAVNARQQQIAQVEEQNKAKMDTYNQQVAQAEAARQQQIMMQQQALQQMFARNPQRQTMGGAPKYPQNKPAPAPTVKMNNLGNPI